MNRTIKKFLVCLTAVAFITTGTQAWAASTLPLTLEQHTATSVAVFRGTVLDQSFFTDPNDGLIYTRTIFRVDESVKGIFPVSIKLLHRGGRVGLRDDFFGLSPRFVSGGEYLLFISRREDGQLACTQGASSAMPLARLKVARGQGELIPAHRELVDNVRALAAQEQSPADDVTDQAAAVSTKAVTGLLTTNGVSSRFIQQDRGEPIPYLIDATSLPTGVTLAQATNAVRQALAAWTAVTSLKFQFDGLQNFGAGADTIAIEDGRLRIQLHDNFNRINSPNVLGVGGRAGRSSPLPSVSWDIGGSVGTNDFWRSAYGYVVLERTNAALQNTQTLAEVLCHEIGHALSMAHSSEVATNNSVITNSIMYFQAHADGRGATLGAYDPPVIQQAYPFNTPPWSYDRVMDITTIVSGSPNQPGINEVQLRGYDLQSTNLTFIVTNVYDLDNGFSVAGTLVKYAPNGFFGTGRLDPAGNQFYDLLCARFSDGTNSSPYIRVRTLSFNPEQVGTLDGIPDAWMVTYFGNADPAVGLKHKASDDADGDGMINLQEYRSGMDPTNAASGQRITLFATNTIQFQAKAYELYELLGSTNMTNWSRVMNPLVPTTATGTFSGFTNSAPYRFFRVLKVP